MNGANYIADFERHTSGTSLDPVTLSFPSTTSLYDSIVVSVNNNKGPHVKDKSNMIVPQHATFSAQDPIRKAKGRSSSKYAERR